MTLSTFKFCGIFVGETIFCLEVGCLFLWQLSRSHMLCSEVTTPSPQERSNVAPAGLALTSRKLARITLMNCTPKRLTVVGIRKRERREATFIDPDPQGSQESPGAPRLMTFLSFKFYVHL